MLSPLDCYTFFRLSVASSDFFFFFLMIRRPRIPPLFPYTPLSRCGVFSKKKTPAGGAGCIAPDANRSRGRPPPASQPPLFPLSHLAAAEPRRRPLAARVSCS